MFESTSKRYMTRMVAETIHIEIQNILWGLIDEQGQKNLKLDYLQLFELEAKKGKQYIIHKQEVPESKLKWCFQLKDTTPINQTLWCIDSETHQTMLLPSDY